MGHNLVTKCLHTALWPLVQGYYPFSRHETFSHTHTLRDVNRIDDVDFTIFSFHAAGGLLTSHQNLAVFVGGVAYLEWYKKNVLSKVFKFTSPHLC